MLDNRLITFTCAGIQYGIPIDAVREVIQLDRVEPVPAARPPLLGVMIYRRHQVIPVFSLVQAMGRGEADKGRLLLVLDSLSELCGLSVERIGQVVDWPGDGSVMEPDAGELGPEGVVTGVLELEGVRVVLLRLGALLSPLRGEIPVS